MRGFIYFKTKSWIMKKFLFYVLTALFLSACSEVELNNNLSTSEAKEKYALELKNKSFMVFPQVREEPIKWFDSIPESRLDDAFSKAPVKLNTNPGEYFVFQLGVWALNDISNLQIELTDLKGNNKKAILSSSITCFNKGGYDFKGNSFTKEINIQAGRVQALWFGIDLAVIKKGNYKGSVSVLANGEKQTVQVKIKVSGPVVPNHGYNESKRLSRLNWLNSTLGIDEEVTKGYIPVSIVNKTVKILGRDLSIAPDGLPAQIISYFRNSNQSLSDKGEPVVNKPFRFIIQNENGEIVRLVPGELKFVKNTPSKIVWTVLNTSDDYDLIVTGQMEFDGFVDYHLKLTAKSSSRAKDIRLEVPVVPEKAEYMMGLNHEGGYRTPNWKWKWDVSKNQDMVWIGGVTGGLRLKLKAENYVRPLINIYYGFGPLKLPPSWGNGDKGGVNIGQSGSDVVINAYSGPRKMMAGEILNYDFDLLVTPLKVIDRQKKFGDRYFWRGENKSAAAALEDAKRLGANVIIYTDLQPYINYPYFDEVIPELKQIVKNAHDQNLRLKFYNTTRELTVNLPEFRAFNSLNGEIFFPGPGNSVHTDLLHPNGPDEWLIKNMRENYLPAWVSEFKEGRFRGRYLSVVTKPDSRLNNFYLSGLDWMLQNIGIDGVYIDDSALDRTSFRRARKLIDKYRPEGRIDLHSWNHFNKYAGFASCLNIYMDLLPYFDLTWIGEARDYDRAPDHWLVEVSGIPFGLPGQMLQDGGNPWRGMAYGITNRAGWTPNPPTHIWEFWDEYRIQDKLLIGYWEKNCPVKISDPSVKASVFSGDDLSVIAVANWTDREKKVSLAIDWTKLGLERSKTEISMPAIRDFQEGMNDVSTGSITIPGKQGFIIVLKKK